MNKKDFEDLTIFLGNNQAFIAKKLKNGKPGKNRRMLNEQEVMSFVTWFVRTYCKKYGMDEFTLNVDDIPTYKFGLIKQDGDDVKVDIINAENK